MSDKPRVVNQRMGTRDRRLTIYTEPVAKGRPRCGKTEYGEIRMFTPNKTRRYEELIATLWKEAYGADHWEGPVWIALTFYEGPRQKEKWQDVDNLAKAVLDALNGVMYLDDRQVVHFSAHAKRSQAEPRVDIIVYLAEEHDDYIETSPGVARGE